jgi:hypothetical protein
MSVFVGEGRLRLRLPVEGSWGAEVHSSALTYLI